jgi:UDP-glucose 4-epimerase
LIGSEASVFFSRRGFQVVGIDSNHRAVFFGPEGDTSSVLERLRREIPGYRHHALDIRDRTAVLALLDELRPHLIIHTAAQPSHDQAAAIPFLDFEVNALGTLHLLEEARQCGSIVRNRRSFTCRRIRCMATGPTPSDLASHRWSSGGAAEESGSIYQSRGAHKTPVCYTPACAEN